MEVQDEIPGSAEPGGGEIRQEAGEVITRCSDVGTSSGTQAGFYQANLWSQSTVATQIGPAGHLTGGCPAAGVVWGMEQQRIGIRGSDVAGMNTAHTATYHHPQYYANHAGNYYSYPIWPAATPPQFVHASQTWSSWFLHPAWTAQSMPGIPALSGLPGMGTPWGLAGPAASPNVVASSDPNSGCHGSKFVHGTGAPCGLHGDEDGGAGVPGLESGLGAAGSPHAKEQMWLSKLNPPNGCPWVVEAKKSSGDEARGNELERWQQWLLFLRHSVHCTGSMCALGEGCSAGKALWRHMLMCESAACAYASCRRTRAVLAHQRECDSSLCPLCGPLHTMPTPTAQQLLRSLPDLWAFHDKGPTDRSPSPTPQNRIPGIPDTPEDILQCSLNRAVQFADGGYPAGPKDLDVEVCAESDETGMMESCGREVGNVPLGKTKEKSQSPVVHGQRAKLDSDAEGKCLSDRTVSRRLCGGRDLDSAFKDEHLNGMNGSKRVERMPTSSTNRADVDQVTQAAAGKPTNTAGFHPNLSENGSQKLESPSGRREPSAAHVKRPRCQDMGTQAKEPDGADEPKGLLSDNATSHDAGTNTVQSWTPSRWQQSPAQVGECNLMHSSTATTVIVDANADRNGRRKGEPPMENKLVGGIASNKLVESQTSPLRVSVQVQTESHCETQSLSVFDSRESKLGGTQTTNGSQHLGVALESAATSNANRLRIGEGSRRNGRHGPTSPTKSGGDESNTPLAGRKNTSEFWQNPYKYSIPTERINTGAATLAHAKPDNVGTHKETDANVLKEGGGVSDAMTMKSPKAGRNPGGRDWASNRSQAGHLKDMVGVRHREQRKDIRVKKRKPTPDPSRFQPRKISQQVGVKRAFIHDAHQSGEKTGDNVEVHASKFRKLPISEGQLSTMMKPKSKIGKSGRSIHVQEKQQRIMSGASSRQGALNPKVQLHQGSSNTKGSLRQERVQGLFAAVEGAKKPKTASEAERSQEGPAGAAKLKVRLRMSGGMGRNAGKGDSGNFPPPAKQDSPRMPLSLCSCFRQAELHSHIEAIRCEMGSNLRKVAPGMGRIGEETCVVCKHQSLKYSPRGKNLRIPEEPWVQCDGCQGWVHQVCSLFNSRLNGTGIHYLCPICELRRLKNNPHASNCAKPKDMDARSLPTCDLSEHLEARLKSALTREWKARCKQNGGGDVPKADGLTVRVVYSQDRVCVAGQHFRKAFEGMRAMKFPYRQRVIMLFQKIDGVDVLLFCMYAQEYGPESPKPNRGWIYLAYVDSIKYFQPNVTAGVFDVPLRTLVYHELLLGYMVFAQHFGYHSMFIWACPPGGKDNDYIMNCHPPSQKIPTEARLRRWYLDLLERARKEGLVTEHSNMSEVLQCKEGAFGSALQIPYFDGDYWPEETEKLLEGLHSKAKNRAGGDLVSGEVGEGCGMDRELMSLLRGSQSVSAWQNFLLARFQQRCGLCREFIQKGYAWTCHPSKPQAGSGPSFLRSSSNGLTCRADGSFVVCPGCYQALHNSSSSQCLKLPAGCSVESFVKEVYKPNSLCRVPNDKKIECSFLETRDLFLRVCQWNHYEFDSLRKAKHSSLMVLHHLMNPDVPVLPATCQVCRNQLEGQTSWKCSTCHDVRFCENCYATGLRHVHTLERVGPEQQRMNGKGGGDPEKASAPARGKVRRGKVWESLATPPSQSTDPAPKHEDPVETKTNLLIHAQSCSGEGCGIPKCQKAREVLEHIRSNCRNHECKVCFRFRRLLGAHRRFCKGLDCGLEHCSQSRLFKGKRIAEHFISDRPTKRQK